MAVTALVSDPIAFRCVNCGTHWTVARKPDGTWPQFARCPRLEGGCGKAVRVPIRSTRPAKIIQLRPASDAAGWDPLCDPIQAIQTDERCPACAGQLLSTPSQTWLHCPACDRLAVPAALALLSRQEESERKAPTRAELSAERRDVAEAKAAALAWLRDRIAKLPAGLAGRMESYLDDIKQVSSMTELRELDQEFSADSRLLAAISATARAVPDRTLAIGAPALAEQADDDSDDGGLEDDAVRGAGRSRMTLFEAARELLGGTVMPGITASPAAIRYAISNAPHCERCGRPAMMEALYGEGFTWQLCEACGRWMKDCPGVSFEVRTWYGLPPADWTGGAQ